MELMSNSLIEKIPGLYKTEVCRLEDKVVHAKFFTPWTNWTWFVIEYDPCERIAWGLVIGHEAEFGYFSLKEIEEIKGPAGLRIERDLHFKPIVLRDLYEKLKLGLRLGE